MNEKVLAKFIEEMKILKKYDASISASFVYKMLCLIKEQKQIPEALSPLYTSGLDEKGGWVANGETYIWGIKRDK